VKKTIHVPDAAVREFAMSVIRRVQALVYNMLADAMMRSLE
jgi:hypothetical protein